MHYTILILYQYYTILYYTILYYCVQYYTTLCCNVLYYTINTTLYYPIVLLYYTILYFTILLKVKVKCFPYRAGVAQRVGRGLALLFHDH